MLRLGRERILSQAARLVERLDEALTHIRALEDQLSSNSEIADDLVTLLKRRIKDSNDPAAYAVRGTVRAYSVVPIDGHTERIAVIEEADGHIYELRVTHRSELEVGSAVVMSVSPRPLQEFDPRRPPIPPEETA